MFSGPPKSHLVGVCFFFYLWSRKISVIQFMEKQGFDFAKFSWRGLIYIYI